MERQSLADKAKTLREDARFGHRLSIGHLAVGLGFTGGSVYEDIQHNAQLSLPFATLATVALGLSFLDRHLSQRRSQQAAELEAKNQRLLQLTTGRAEQQPTPLDA